MGHMKVKRKEFKQENVQRARVLNTITRSVAANVRVTQNEDLHAPERELEDQQLHEEDNSKTML
jgi:hypothetical protein